MNDDLVPSKVFSRLIHFWWALALFMIVGGLAGLVAARFHRPVFESQSVITSIADYSVLGQVDDWDNDQLYSAIGDVIGSTSVKNEVIAKVQAAKLPLSETETLASLTLDRQDNRWVMHVRLDDPRVAQQVNSYWAESAMQALEAVKAKAVTGFESQQYINSLVTCLQQSVVVEANSTTCNAQTFTQIQNQLKDIASDPDLQISSGSLLLLHTSFALTTQATLPGSPALYAQNLLALAGMLIALIVGLVVLSLDFPVKNK